MLPLAHTPQKWHFLVGLPTHLQSVSQPPPWQCHVLPAKLFLASSQDWQHYPLLLCPRSYCNLISNPEVWPWKLHVPACTALSTLHMAIPMYQARVPKRRQGCMLGSVVSS